MNPKSEHVLFTHGGCPDGEVCAWLMSRANPQIKIFNVFDRNKLPVTDDYLRELNVVITDVCFISEIMEKLMIVCNTLTIIDHHQTTVPILKKLVDDKNNYRARLDYLFSEDY